jgi:hypothetical protein
MTPPTEHPTHYLQWARRGRPGFFRYLAGALLNQRPCWSIAMPARKFEVTNLAPGTGILAIGPVLGFASTAGAQTAPGLGDLIGARGYSVESELQSRGYEFATNLGSAARWWNPRTKACVSVAIDEGRADSLACCD